MNGSQRCLSTYTTFDLFPSHYIKVLYCSFENPVHIQMKGNERLQRICYQKTSKFIHIYCSSLSHILVLDEHFFKCLFKTILCDVYCALTLSLVFDMKYLLTCCSLWGMMGASFNCRSWGRTTASAGCSCTTINQSILLLQNVSR